MTRLTFARTAPPPPGVTDWDALAAFADSILAERRDKLPAQVEAGMLTQAAADARLRIAAALAAQWRDASAGRALPDPADYAERYGASCDELLAETATIAARTAQRRAANPTSSAAIQDDLRAAALHWHQRPVADGAYYPHIWKAADHAAWARSRQQRARAA
jgi:hypothetical protein